MKTKVSLGFARLSDGDLDTFAQGVIDSMTGNAAYPSPPATMAALQTAKNDFSSKVAAAQIGGPPDTAAKRNSRQTLEGMLRQVASYVQMSCGDDMATLLSSGFQAQNFNNAQTPLTQPVSLAVKNGSSGQLIARVDPVKNTSMYEGRIKGDDGAWSPSIFTGDSQHIIFAGLTPGKTYTVQVRALGGSTGQSDWSDPSSHMAT
jgi:hypothetical protein